MARRKITKRKVVSGLKYVAENYHHSAEELAAGLKRRGCFFSYEDWFSEFGDKPGDLTGRYHGDLDCAAKIIVDMASSDSDRKWGAEKFFWYDGPGSAYDVVRLLTGKQSYTKEHVDKRLYKRDWRWRMQQRRKERNLSSK